MTEEPSASDLEAVYNACSHSNGPPPRYIKHSVDTDGLVHVHGTEGFYAIMSKKVFKALFGRNP